MSREAGKGSKARPILDRKTFEDNFDAIFRKPKEDWDEDRIDVIGQNGNDGLHYKEKIMSDEADQANLQVELNERRSIAYASQQANLPIPISEVCLFCTEPTEDGRRFCDAFCRDEYEKRKFKK